MSNFPFKYTNFSFSFGERRALRMEAEHWRQLTFVITPYIIVLVICFLWPLGCLPW